MARSIPATFEKIAKFAGESEERLFRYLEVAHLRRGQLVGPDIGVRWNRVLFHLIKSYLDFLPWNDDHVFCQAQGYWIKVNKAKYLASGDERFLNHAVETSNDLVERQTPDGYWPHPLKTWRGRASTIEGNFAALGLFDAYSLTNDARYLDAAQKWLNFLVRRTGFQNYRDGVAVNYFSVIPSGLVPNASTITMVLLSRGADTHLKGDYSKYLKGMVRFISKCQKPSGELPYAVGINTGKGRPHYQCYQYNAFQFLDLCEVLDISGLSELQPIMGKLSSFLSSGIGSRGDCRYACGKPFPNVIYHAAVLAASLLEASVRGLGDYWEETTRAYRYVLARQRPDGSFPWSEREYGIFKDNRRYPHNLVMILWHLWMASNRVNGE